MPGEDQQDLAALIAVAAGDRRAFGPFVMRHRDAVFRYARALCPNDAAAEDVLQEAFVSAFRNAGSYRGEGAARAWLFRIAHNEAATARRKRVGEPQRLEPLEALGAAAGWGADASEPPLDRIADREALELALGALEDEEREILMLRDVEGLSGPETASLLGLSLAAMKSRLHRARLRIAAELRKGGFDGPRS